MIYNQHKCGSYNIHTIKTNKFKNIRMEIIFRNNVDKETIASRTLLFDMLMENSKNYPTKRDLVLKFESLYNAYVYSSTNKIGNQTSSSIIMDFLNPNLTEDDFLEEAISLPFDLIFNPNINNEEFDNKTLTTIKTRVISDIKCISENPAKLTIKNAMKTYAPDSVTSISLSGEIDDVESITATSLYKVYEDTLKHDYVDIYVIGDIDENKVVDYITKYAKFNTIKKHELTMFIDNKKVNKPIVKKDKSEFSQTHITYVYNTFDLNEFERKYVFNLYNAILGGGALESKLSKKLRGDNSLCYGVQSVYHKYDNTMFIYTSVDNKNIKITKKLIEETVNEMINKVTEEELEMEKSLTISSITMGLDNPGRIISQYYFHNVAELDLVDERIKLYKTVTLDDIKKVCKKIKLNTIYMLEGEENGKN